MEEKKETNQEIIDEQDDIQDEVADTSEETEEKSEYERLEEEKNEIYNRLMRIQADYDNFKRRTQKEKEEDRKYKSKDLISELIPVLDNFERALQVEGDSAKGFADGVEMVYQQFKSALEKEGVEEIPADGEEFDPHKHQAVMQVEDENYGSNVVVETMQKGYQLHDRVIRPAMVKVNQ
ncbi:nucleotide exchange factor GrpE [Thalassobacillus sp. CUG 92003]|uniref:nucleotide exchange factor GrpE n=1 Tax=Thalassobacillus sp. CUG 92003 TaxID=2736641 RepID=UPI0015E6B10F